MKQQTTWLGIDLGTTRTVSARVEGTSVRIFSNAHGCDYTPCAVWIDPTNHIRTGQQAYDRAESDPENVAIEFKRNMESRDEFRFARSGLTMRPEQLSAEVLKGVRADAERATGEAMTRAVITVPATFQGPGRDATLKAAQLAGFQEIEFLQEPVAAALAYSFDHPPLKEFWLVFDLSDGRFDCALLELTDGVINVVSHGGDHRLGGKNIDWDIVEKVFIPEIQRKHGKNKTPSRGDRAWSGAIAKLKMAAESGKRKLSGSDSVFVSVEKIESFGGRDGYEFVYTLDRGELENLARPHIEKAIDICRSVLTQGHMEPSHVSKLLLVGDPTMMPVVRKMLSTPGTGLEIPLDSSIDPLTVMARGAAIYGASKIITIPAETEVAEAHQFSVAITAYPSSSDPEVLVAFAFAAPSETVSDFSGYTVEILNSSSRPGWNSGKIALSHDGRSMARIVAEQDTENIFQIQLFDTVGRCVKLVDGQFNVTVGSPREQLAVLPHSIGVALPDNSVSVFMPKDTTLPARRTQTLRTSRFFKAGDSAQLLDVIVLEGEQPRADRNKRSGRLSISGGSVTRDVPENEPIEITLDVDRSGVIRATAYLSLLDQIFEKVLDSVSTTPTQEELKERLEELEKRTTELESEATQLNSTEAATALTAFRKSGQLDDLRRLRQAAATDNDATRQADDHLIVAHLSLDAVEAHLEWPRLVRATQDQIRTNLDSHQILSDAGRRETDQLAEVARQQIEARNQTGLEKTHEMLLAICVGKKRVQNAENLATNLETESTNNRHPMSAIASPANPSLNDSGRALLNDLLRPGYFERNAFRILELPADTTRRQIDKRIQTIELAVQNGMLVSHGSGRCLPLAGAPDTSALGEARNRLTDVRRRFVDELFWFWPEPNSTTTAAAALAVGHTNEAVLAWKSQEDAGPNDPGGLVAIHNIATLYLLSALSMVTSEEQASDREEAPGIFEEALLRWHILLETPAFWSRLDARAGEINHPRLADAVPALRAALPGVVAALPLLCIASVTVPVAKQLTNLVRESGLAKDAVEDALRQAARSLSHRILSASKAAKDAAESSPLHAAQTCTVFLDQVEPWLGIIDQLLPATDSTRIKAHDETALAVLSCQVDFCKETDRWDLGIPLLERGGKLAASDDTVAKLKSNLETIRKNHDRNDSFRSAGYHSLPKDVFDEMEKARHEVQAKNFDPAIGRLRTLHKRGGPDAPAVSKALAYTLGCCSLNRINHSMDNLPSPVDYVRGKLKDRVNSSGFMLTAMMAQSGRLTSGAECMVCGTSIYGSYATLRIPDLDLPVIVCSSCSAKLDRMQEERKSQLQNTFQRALDELYEATNLDPTNRWVTGQIVDTEKIAGNVGVTIRKPSPKSTRPSSTAKPSSKSESKKSGSVSPNANQKPSRPLIFAAIVIGLLLIAGYIIATQLK